MDLSPEQIERIKELGGLLLSLNEIAIDLDIPFNEFEFEYSNSKSELYKTYNKAVIETKIKLRKPVIEMAAMGGPHAQQIAHTYLSDQKFSDE